MLLIGILADPVRFDAPPLRQVPHKHPCPWLVAVLCANAGESGTDGVSILLQLSSKGASSCASIMSISGTSGGKEALHDLHLARWQTDIAAVHTYVPACADSKAGSNVGN